jgi:hypothetical protein
MCGPGRDGSALSGSAPRGGQPVRVPVDPLDRTVYRGAAVCRRWLRGTRHMCGPGRDGSARGEAVRRCGQPVRVPVDPLGLLGDRGQDREVADDRPEGPLRVYAATWCTQADGGLRCCWFGNCQARWCAGGYLATIPASPISVRAVPHAVGSARCRCSGDGGTSQPRDQLAEGPAPGAEALAVESLAPRIAGTAISV